MASEHSPLAQFSDQEIAAEHRRRQAIRQQENEARKQRLDQTPLIDRDPRSLLRVDRSLPETLKSLLALYEDTENGIFNSDFLRLQHHTDFVTILSHLTRSLRFREVNPVSNFLCYAVHPELKAKSLYLPISPDLSTEIKTGESSIKLMIPSTTLNHGLTAEFNVTESGLGLYRFETGSLANKDKAAATLREVAMLCTNS